MRVTIFGLGYVGTVCGTCLADHGHQVTGVDVQPTKVDLVNQALAPVVEPDLQERLTAVVQAGRLRATLNVEEAMRNCEVALLCVGTPSLRDGSLNLSYLEKVATQVGECLKIAADFPVVAVRSTVPPGTLAYITGLLEKASGLMAGQDFGVVCNPEFLREGSALKDFESPPFTLVGTLHPRADAIMRRLYEHVNAPFQLTEPGPAEILKYVNNSWHALKIAFANEVGVVCKGLGVDSHEVMRLFCADTHLNVSAAYLRPGFAYGGSCLPKDLGALNETARRVNARVPVLASIAASNDAHIEHCIRLVEETGARRLGFLGLSFKAHTDDLRESPAVRVVETLLGRGYEICIFDPNVNVARLVGANREFIETRIRHLSRLLVDSVAELVEFADAVVVTNNDPAYTGVAAQLRAGQHLVDFSRVDDHGIAEGNYHGVCW